MMYSSEGPWSERRVPRLGVGCLFILLITWWLPVSISAAKMLMVPCQATSHVRLFAHAADPLIHRGHQLYSVLNGDCHRSVTTLEKVGVNVLKFYIPQRACFSDAADRTEEMPIKAPELVSMINVLRSHSASLLKDGEALFSNNELVNELRRLDFDLVIVDGMVLSLFQFLIPYKLDIPYVVLATDFSGGWAGVPSLPSFEPAMIQLYTDEMTFTQRVVNTVTTWFVGSYLVYTMPGSEDGLVGRFVPEKPAVSMHTLQRGARLWMLNTDSVIDYPRVGLPHVVTVGGLGTKPARPLDHQLRPLADGATNGFIVVSFGSLAGNFPDSFTRKIFTALATLHEYTVFIKYDINKVPDIPSHVKIVNWLPQNDLLGHPNAKLFITHCGANGQFEALYQAIPMVGLPMFGDQPYNAKRMESKGFGMAMNIFDFGPDDLVENVRRVLGNESYSKAIRHASMIYRSRPQNPTERVVYWVEHILQYGADHLISYGIQLPWYKYWLVDVMAFLAGILLASGIILFLLLRLCIGKLIRGVKKSNTSKVYKEKRN